MRMERQYELRYMQREGFTNYCDVNLLICNNEVSNASDKNNVRGHPGRTDEQVLVVYSYALGFVPYTNTVYDRFSALPLRQTTVLVPILYQSRNFDTNACLFLSRVLNRLEL